MALFFRKELILRNTNPYDTPALLPARGFRKFLYSSWTLRVTVGFGLMVIAASFLSPIAQPFAAKLPWYAKANEVVFPDFQIPGQVDFVNSEPAVLPAVSVSPPRLKIPVLGVDMPIVEGTSEQVLLKGAWRSPWSSTPDKGGNTVIFGHRWLHLPPHKETFYSLDKLAVGDTFQVLWNDEQMTYRVVASMVVAPTDLSVLKQTERSTITLITCTPLYSTKQRLVIRAELQ